MSDNDLSGTIADLRSLSRHFYETEQNQAADIVRGASEIIESLQQENERLRDGIQEMLDVNGLPNTLEEIGDRLLSNQEKDNE